VPVIHIRILMNAAVVRDQHLSEAVPVIRIGVMMTAAAARLFAAACHGGGDRFGSAVEAGVPDKGIAESA